MFLSNSLVPEQRRPGCVGLPLPGVELRIVSAAGDIVAPGSTEQGELRFKGDNLFQGCANTPYPVLFLLGDSVYVGVFT